jgi:signal transduction histidine kinase
MTILTVALRDITEQIQQEKRLLRQAEELKRSNQLMTLFFTNISHEFKTPLTLILNLIGMTEMRVKSADCQNRENMIKNLSVMRQNAHRLLRLVANLLDVTKMDAGFMQVYYQVMDLPRWMGKLVQSVEDFAEQRGIHVTFHDDSDIQFIPMDGEKLDRIMLNLISNAIKHTGRGGHIAITMTDEANKLLILVADDGEGIPVEKQCLIFDRFRQANASLTRASEGSGIGLALTKALVELLRGRIWFQSTPGKGTTFFVELPVTELPNDSQLPVMDGLTLNRKVEMEFSDII